MSLCPCISGNSQVRSKGLIIFRFNWFWQGHAIEVVLCTSYSVTSGRTHMPGCPLLGINYKFNPFKLVSVVMAGSKQSVRWYLDIIFCLVILVCIGDDSCLDWLFQGDL